MKASGWQGGGGDFMRYIHQEYVEVALSLSGMGS